MAAKASGADDYRWALRLAADCNVTAGITYRVVNGFEIKLDVYGRWTTQPLRPTVMFMHGGGWMKDATKETWSLWFLPFLQLGWVVVNVDYRPTGFAGAPAAVVDCIHALRWIGRHAQRFGIDRDRLVLAGLSAGAHLALITALNPRVRPKAAAVVNWCGITDVTAIAHGPKRQTFATDWLGDRGDLAAAVSPLTYVRAGLPPIVTVHGDRDCIVPYEQAVRLHEALRKADVVQELITLPGADHPDLEAHLNAYPRVFEFLNRAGLS